MGRKASSRESDLASERIGKRFRNLDSDDVPGLHRRKNANRKVNLTEMGRPTLPLSVDNLLDQDLFGLANMALISDPLLALLLLVENLETAFLLGCWHIVALPHRGRPGPRRVEEDEETLIPSCPYKSAGGFKIFLSFARIAHNDIGGQGDVWTLRSQQCQSLEVFGRRVATAHVSQDRVSAGLNGQMKVGTEPWELCETTREPVVDMRRMGGGEA